jgi:multiple sugar transport system substrate-binding protein
VPETWQQYEQLQQFFYRPAQDLYGVSEERDEEGAWMYWLPRYASTAAPYRALFDAQMRPLINSPEGVAATESYVAAVRFSPAGITENGNGYSFALPIFARGKAFATMSTVAGARLFNGEGSAVRGRFMAAPMPGNRIGGRLVRRNTIIYGNNLVIAQSGNRKLAFLYAMWLTDPDVSLRSVGITGGFADPYRHHHLQHERIRSAYTPEALQVFLNEWAVALPAGTGLRGDRAYLAALDRNLTRAARGEISAQEAMANTAAEWDAITARYGRAAQRSELKKRLNLSAVRQ